MVQLSEKVLRDTPQSQGGGKNDTKTGYIGFQMKHIVVDMLNIIFYHRGNIICFSNRLVLRKPRLYLQKEVFDLREILISFKVSSETSKMWFLLEIRIASVRLCVCRIVGSSRRTCCIYSSWASTCQYFLYDEYLNKLETVRRLYGKERLLWCPNSILSKTVVLDGFGYRLSPYLQK